MAYRALSRPASTDRPAPQTRERQAPAPQPADAPVQRQVAPQHPAAASVPIGNTARQPLPTPLRQGIESLSGLDMSDVRVHHRSPRPTAIGAHAFAQGGDIHLAPGQERHLPHEAWHVVQQKQGRVQATMQFNGGVAVNADGGLEREADLMGARALGGSVRQATPQPNLVHRTAPGGAQTPVQAVWVIRGGHRIWEDPYVPQDGDTFPPEFTQRPSVLVDKGKTEVRFDKSGKQSVGKRKNSIRTHKVLQKDRERQGKKLRTLLKNNPKIIKNQAAELRLLSGHLEKITGVKKHAEKVRKIYKEGDVTGKRFRAIDKAQDEFTQSEATSSFLSGFRQSGGDTPQVHRDELDEYGELLLRFLSSLRAPTETILAPITYKGSTTGQQHPTSDDQDKLTGGSSSHAFSDRSRVEAQVDLFESSSSVSNAPPNAVLLASSLGALISTLSSMSAPTSANNLPSFNSGRQDTQVKEREGIKAQTNIIAKSLGIKINEDVQDYDAPWTEQETPTSPRRNERGKPPVGDKKGDKAPPSTSDPQTKTSDVQPQTNPVVSAIEHVQHTAQMLLNAIPNLQQNPYHQNLQTFGGFIQQVYHAAGQVDTSNPQNVQILNNMSAYLYQYFRHFEGLIQRRHITQNPPGNPTGPTGQRLPSLQQFFAECGQMATHNALVLAHFPDLAHPNAHAALVNEGFLRQYGTFENYIGENQIRTMIIAAGRYDIPVIGNIGQVAGIVTMLQQGDYQGLQNHNISPEEQYGAVQIANFISGASDSLVMVINTVAEQGADTVGEHWISLRVTRQVDGQLAIQYLDSYVGTADYSALFQGVRNFLTHVPHQQQPGHHVGSGSGDDGGGWDDSLWGDLSDFGIDPNGSNLDW